MTAKSDLLIEELVSACVAFGRGQLPDWQTRIETARQELRAYVEQFDGLEEDSGSYDSLIPDWAYWIPVSRELPKEYRDEEGEFIPFLVCESDKDYPFRAVYDGTNWGDGMFVVDVTHWMPLPKLPEVQE